MRYCPIIWQEGLKEIRNPSKVRGLKVHGNINKIFYGNQSCHLVKNQRHFGDHLCPHHQGNDDGVRGPEETVIFNQLTRLIARQTCITFSNDNWPLGQKSKPVFCRKEADRINNY